mmetsp:Transcript_19739/g.62137  ORF Transcript_19739/g.62137 Transcript_19739/m.62137 type:complete len:107 (+) Transcript_19739:57-377(+)
MGQQEAPAPAGLSPLVRFGVILVAVMYGRDLLLGSPAKKEAPSAAVKTAPPSASSAEEPVEVRTKPVVYSGEDEEFSEYVPQKTAPQQKKSTLLGPRNVLVKLCTS